jgi:uracil-DNA glycosylase
MNGKGQEGQGRVFTGDAGEVAFAFLGAIEESDNNLGQLVLVLGV